MKLYLFCAAVFAACALSPVQSAWGAADDRQVQAAEAQRLSDIVASQHRHGGDVVVPGTEATLHLGSRYYFLDAAEAKQVLKEWGNPPSAADGVLGIVFPADKTFLDDSWAGVITYEQAGYISDADSDKVDYRKFVDQAQQAKTPKTSSARRMAFHPFILLAGPSSPPMTRRTITSSGRETLNSAAPRRTR